MKTPETSRLFEKRIDPVSGVERYLLSPKLFRHQQGFYFCNDCMSADGRYLWFCIGMRPGEDRLLAVVDFERDEAYVLEDTLSAYASPYIDTETGEAYFLWKNTIYRRHPAPEAQSEALVTLKTDVPACHIATHLTRSSDKKKFFLDILDANGESYIGLIDIETGEFTKWTDCAFHTNHGQLNPKNDSLALCAYDDFTHPVTGVRYGIPSDENGNYLRLWTYTADGKAATYPPLEGFATHEFWSADGKKIYYCDPWHGLNRIHLETGAHEQVHACRSWHAFASADENYLLYDHKLTSEETFYRGGPAAVNFVNRKTGKDIAIASALPPIGAPERPFNYHPDPHPRFVGGEKYVLFTTTERGTLDVALVSVAHLLEKTE